MTKDELFKQIEVGLSEILKESFDWCKSDDTKTSSTASKINNRAYELKNSLEKYRNRNEESN